MLLKAIKRSRALFGEWVIHDQKIFYNQSQNNKKEYHYNTSGTIHSFGYSAIYHQHPITWHTIDKFATSKFSTIKSLLMRLRIIFEPYFISLFLSLFHRSQFKKIKSDDLEKIEKLEQKVYNFLDSSVTFVNNRFLPLRNKNCHQKLLWCRFTWIFTGRGSTRKGIWKIMGL